MKKIDKINLLHVYSSSDSGKKNPTRMRDEYETELVGNFHRSRYSLTWHNRDQDSRSVKEILADISVGDFEDIRAPDFIVLGYSGWKFNSDGSREATSAGSTTDFCLREVRHPIVIVKGECSVGPKHIVMAVNNSNTSKLGLDIVYTLLGPRDRLTVVTISDHARADAATEQYYTNELRHHCPTTQSTFVNIRRTADDSLCDALNNYIDRLDVEMDFLALAPRSREEKIVSSFTEKVIQEVKANIILCKV
jgi:hypothetical protein